MLAVGALLQAHTSSERNKGIAAGKYFMDIVDSRDNSNQQTVIISLFSKTDFYL